jgi:hypothetical protein
VTAGISARFSRGLVRKWLTRTQKKARAAELIAEEMTLRELRHAHKLTQVNIAKTLWVTQDSVSRLEKRTDLLLSTLRRTVEATGGNLSLVAEFPDRAPVVLSGIAETDLLQSAGQSWQAEDVSPKIDCRVTTQAKGARIGPKSFVYWPCSGGVRLTPRYAANDSYGGKSSWGLLVETPP